MSRFDPCARKKAYPSYRQAREVVQRMREQADGDPTLNVFKCPTRDHYHVGHARGQRAEKLRKRAQRLGKEAGHE